MTSVCGPKVFSSCPWLIWSKYIPCLTYSQQYPSSFLTRTEYLTLYVFFIFTLDNFCTTGHSFPVPARQPHQTPTHIMLLNSLNILHGQASQVPLAFLPVLLCPLGVSPLLADSSSLSFPNYWCDRWYSMQTSPMIIYAIRIQIRHKQTNARPRMASWMIMSSLIS